MLKCFTCSVSDVFNNVDSALKAQSRFQAQRLSALLGTVKARLVPSRACGEFG